MKKDSTEKKQKYSDAKEASENKFKKKTIWDFFTGQQEAKKEAAKKEEAKKDV